MTQPRLTWKNPLLITAALIAAGALLLKIGCQDRTARPGQAARTLQNRSDDSAYLINTVADSLNNLPREVVLELEPPVPILDDAKSEDGQPVLAACNVTPAVPDGPYNFLYVTSENANFRKLRIRPGDKVRYFVNVDEDSMEHGIAQMKSFELTVRRLDLENPRALIFEGGLSNAVSVPEAARIEIWRVSDKRMIDITKRINRYYNAPKVRIGWEPSPDESALTQLLERTNQWFSNLNTEEQAWEPEPLVSELAEELRGAKPLAGLLADTALRSGSFEPTEVRQLQQAIWLRDVSRWAKGEAVSPLEVATALFDWTIRNIQLDNPDEAGYVHQPWQALMYGHGQVEHRAWVFAELCRQQQLDVVVLTTGGQFWLPALLHDGQLHLFDTRLGLPIPGKESGDVATLAAVADDPSLLSQLDLDEQQKYPITAEELKSVHANLVAAPLQLARRALLAEQALETDHYVVLSAGTRRIAEQLEKHDDLANIRLWSLPFESVLAERTMAKVQRLRAGQRFLVFASRPRLWKARVLHFQGTKEIPIAQRNNPLAQPDLGHRQATALYQDPRIRPPKVRLEKVAPTKRAIYETAKQDASYWLGLLSYDLGKYKVAEDWLARRTLAASPEGPWTAGARYNLARTHEARGNFAAAIKLLESDESPQRQGNLLRARRLQTQLESVKRQE